jgi:hypothetical protein
MTPADAFTTGELIGISAADGDGQAAASAWYRNTFVKLRAAGTHPVELPTRVPASHTSVKPKRALKPAPAEVQVPQTVKNLRRAG